MKARLTCLVATISLLLWSSMALAATAMNAEAQKHFDAGVAYVDDPNGSKWEEALKEFRAAYAESPTWKLMNNIGLCALNLERDGEAVEAYKSYLASGGDKDLNPKQRKQMEKDIAMLSASLVRVSFEVEPAEAILIDERGNSKGGLLVNQYPIKGGKALLGIHPGLHKFTLQAPGFVSADWSFNAEPSSTHQRQFKLEPEKKPEAKPPTPLSAPAKSAASVTEAPKRAERQTPTAVYFSLAATGVFAAAATVTGVVAVGKAKDFDSTSDPDERHRIAKSGRTFTLLTDVGIGAAILGAGATAYFYFTAPKASPATGKANVNVSPVATPSAAGIAVSGKF